MDNICTRTRGFLVSIVLTSYNAKNNRLNRCGDCVTKGTSSDDLFKALDRYLEESGEPGRSVASRIGINYHIPGRWLADKRSPNKAKLAYRNLS
jgi:hypothetical protein